jgi:dihydrofolate reductase/thymidylate synthase
MSENISLIVAVDKNDGISLNGKIPWSIQEDLNFFSDVTKRRYRENRPNLLVVGKNTWFEIRDRIKDRAIIVVSASLHEEDISSYPNTWLESNFKSALSKTKLLLENQYGQAFICGGSSIYDEAIKRECFGYIYITTIQQDYQCDNKIFAFRGYGRCVNRGDFTKEQDISIECLDRNSNQKVVVRFEKLCHKDFSPSFQSIENGCEMKYLELLQEILLEGDFHETRNAKTWSKFGKTLKFNLAKGFPLLTTKKCFFRGAVEELLFFLRGDTDANHLSEKGVKFWDGNTTREFLDRSNLTDYEVGDLGTAYGFQWRHFNAEYSGKNANYEGKGYDQVEYCLNLLKTDPYSRRIMMTTYNPSQATTGCLYPCHGISTIFNVQLDSQTNQYTLSCMMVQRSADCGSGFYLNICEYALLVHMFCEVLNNDSSYGGPRFTPGTLITNLGDVHIYENHFTQVVRQILRDPYPFPTLKINKKVQKITDFLFEDFELVGYDPYPAIHCPMNV